MNDNDKPRDVPKLLSHTPVLEEHGKLVFREDFESPAGVISNWLLFGATNVPVIIFPLTQKGKVVALRHFRYGANSEVLELPGGAIEKGETAEKAAARELGEETGYTCEPDAVKMMNPDRGIWFDPASVRVQFIPLFVAGLDDNKQADSLRKPDLGEVSELYQLPIKEWYEKLRNGEIRDSKSYAVSVLVLEFLHKHSCGFWKDAVKGLTGQTVECKTHKQAGSDSRKNSQP